MINVSNCVQYFLWNDMWNEMKWYDFTPVKENVRKNDTMFHDNEQHYPTCKEPMRTNWNSESNRSSSCLCCAPNSIKKILKLKLNNIYFMCV